MSAWESRSLVVVPGSGGMYFGGVVGVGAGVGAVVGVGAGVGAVVGVGVDLRRARIENDAS